MDTLADPLVELPTYPVVHRYEWIGEKHTRLFAQVKVMAEFWGLRYLVAEATSVGAGMVYFLDKGENGTARTLVQAKHSLYGV